LYTHIPKKHFYEHGSIEVLGPIVCLRSDKPLYAERMGRPSLDPVIFLANAWLVGFFENIIYDTELEVPEAGSIERSGVGMDTHSCGMRMRAWTACGTRSLGAVTEEYTAWLPASAGPA